VDLVVGIVLAIGIPLLVYGVLRASGVGKKSTAGQFREKVAVVVKPDAELVELKIKYFQRIYSETGRVFLDRARQATGGQRLRDRDWAKSCFTSLVTDITTVENQLNADEELRSRFSGELTLLSNLKNNVQADLKTASMVY
jgi:hypothetical protein